MRISFFISGVIDSTHFTSLSNFKRWWKESKATDACLLSPPHKSKKKFLLRSTVEAIYDRLNNDYALKWTRSANGNAYASSPLGRFVVIQRHTNPAGWTWLLNGENSGNVYSTSLEARDGAEDHYAAKQAQKDLKRILGDML